jgi:NADH:ubiquinone oxidoreductase subunit F (NADH-binding)
MPSETSVGILDDGTGSATAALVPDPGGTEFPLARIRERRRQAVALADAAAEVARAERRPFAPLLAAARSHADLAAAAGAARVCRGTSCELRGAARVADALWQDGPIRPAYCLGYCYRSPVVLDAAGGVWVDVAPERIVGEAGRPPALPAPPRVSCRAPEPIVTRRIGRGDFAPLPKALADGAYQALARGLSLGPAGVLDELERSGERGRGGAGFLTAAKWRSAAAASGDKVVVANGDEGDPGSFVDRVLLEHDPHGVLEGLALAALAIGASRGVVFIRSEYPRAVQRMRAAVAEAERAGALGASLAVSVVEGFGSYACGEETALIATLEGERGEVRPRPPYPTERGLFGLPTVVNNVETLAAVPWIVERGGDAFAALGTRRSKGTKALCLNAGFASAGIVEVPFGDSLREVIEDAGATSCADLEGVLLGGPMGSLLTPAECDVALCYAALAERGVRLGHGGLVAVPLGSDLPALVRHLLRFAAAESCGRCTPCRAGAARALRLAADDLAGGAAAIRAALDTMRRASLCAFGRETPGPILALLERVAAR